MFFIMWPRLNLIWLILNSLIFVPIKVVSLYCHSRFGIIWLVLISLIILNDNLIFHLWICKLLLVLAAVKRYCVSRSTWMNVALMLMTMSHLLLWLLLVLALLLLLIVLVLVWRKTRINVHEVLRRLLFHHLSLFCKLLLLLIQSHLLLNLLLLLLILLLRLHMVEILLPHSWLLEHLWLLISIIILANILVICILVILIMWDKVLMILLWSIIIIENLRRVVILNILLFVELIITLSKVLHIREFSRFLNMLTPLSFWLSKLWIFDLEVVVIHEVFLVIDRVVIVLSSFGAVVAVIFLKKTLNHQFWWVIIRWLLNVRKLILTIIEDYLLHLLKITHFPWLWENFISLRNFFDWVAYVY